MSLKLFNSLTKLQIFFVISSNFLFSKRDGDDIAMVFGNQSMLDKLNAAGRTHLGVDATFKTSPAGFYQMCVLLFEYRGQMLPFFLTGDYFFFTLVF